MWRKRLGDVRNVRLAGFRMAVAIIFPRDAYEGDNSGEKKFKYTFNKVGDLHSRALLAGDDYHRLTGIARVGFHDRNCLFLSALLVEVQTYLLTIHCQRGVNELVLAG